MKTALVIGAGPAGLMAAGELAKAGCKVTVAEAKPSVARKFLMAGKSGLNLTKDEPFKDFLNAFGSSKTFLRPMLEEFGPGQVQNWANGLGQQVFTGSSGRVFPLAMKASPLLRAWLADLKNLGVEIRTRWRWRGDNRFDTPTGLQALDADTTVLALGGASWARLGSDGLWAEYFADAVPLAPFKPANMGFRVAWSNHMAKHFGKPVKAVELRAGDKHVRAEFVVSKSGIEGGGVYAVSQAVRDGAPLFLDLMPDVNLDAIRGRLKRSRGKSSISNHLRKALRIDPLKQALLMEFGRPLPDDIAPIIKELPVRHGGPQPMDQAISTAGGIKLDALDAGLMIRSMPGTFAAGEMLDWEAPTGGYLLTGCLATGRWAGRRAAEWVHESETL